ncbi:TIGR03943 family protein [Priestia megaterium]|nr:TIGR03943 family protein [Priestia megaterium]
MKRIDEQFITYIRGVLLIGFALLMFKLMLTGKLVYFIAPKMMPFVYVASFTFFLLGIVQIWRSSVPSAVSCECGHDHGEKGRIRTFFMYGLFLLPIMTGFLLSNHTLDSSVASKRGVTFASGVNERPTAEQRQELQERNSDAELEQYMNDVLASEVEEPTEEREIPLEHPQGFVPQPAPDGYYEKLEQKLVKQDHIVVTDPEYISVMNIIENNVEKFVGKTLEIKGFVYREEGFEKNQFVVARFGLSCCVADASVYGTLSTVKNASAFKTDDWIQVKGTIQKTSYHDADLPYLQIETVKEIKQPDNPYVYEMYEGEQLVAPGGT